MDLKRTIATAALAVLVTGPFVSAGTSGESVPATGAESKAEAPTSDTLTREERRKREETARVEARAEEMLNQNITIEVKEGTGLKQFLKTLAFVTGIDYVITHGAEAVPVTGRFTDTSLREILDTTLSPYGFQWYRRGTAVIITPNLKTTVFPVDYDTIVKLRRFHKSKVLQQILWGQDKPPFKSISLHIDDEELALILTDSQERIDKLRRFLAALRKTPPLRLDTRIYRLRPDLAEDVADLVKAMVRVRGVEADSRIMRRVLLAGDGDEAFLVLRDSDKNLHLIDSFLADASFLKLIEDGQMAVYTTSITPRPAIATHTEHLEAFCRNIREVVETMLYHTDGVEGALKDGRRMWYDVADHQLTITDYPRNIRRVAAFLEALPQLDPERRSVTVASRKEEMPGRPVSVPPGFVAKWWVAGPLPNEDDALYGNAYAPERSVALDAGFDVDGKHFGWEKIVAGARGDLNLGESLARTVSAGAYLYTRCAVAQETAVRVLVGCEDGFVAWLNGERIGGVNRTGAKPSGPDSLEAKLAPGMNEILLKVLDREGDWRVSVRIVDSENKPITLGQSQKRPE